jgi:hypothetical protein
MNIISALMIRYEEMGETQWFLTPATCHKDSLCTSTKSVLMIVHNVLYKHYIWCKYSTILCFSLINISIKFSVSITPII